MQRMGYTKDAKNAKNVSTEDFVCFDFVFQSTA